MFPSHLRTKDQNLGNFGTPSPKQSVSAITSLLSKLNTKLSCLTYIFHNNCMIILKTHIPIKINKPFPKGNVKYAKN